MSAYLAEDFVASESLDVAARDHGPSPPEEAVRVASEIAGALDFSADASIFHGALHPRDILVSTDDARLTGLGIARVLDRLGVATSIRRPYTAPERQAGQRWDRRADIFSLAAIVHELIWGRRITALGEEAASSLTPVGAADLDALRHVFARALAANPRDRFESASEFVGELKRGLASANRRVQVADAPASDVRPRSGERRLVVEDELRLPLDEDLFDEPAMSDEPEIIIERSEAFWAPVAAAAEASVPEAPLHVEPARLHEETHRHEETQPHEETFPHEETVPMVLPPVSPDRTVIDLQAQVSSPRSTAPVDDDASFAVESPAAAAVPPPAFAALNEPSRSSLWPLALSLAIGLAVGFAAGYASGGRDGSRLAVDASAATAPPPAEEPAVPKAPVPETEVHLPSVPAREAPKNEAPAPRVTETRPAPAPAAPRRQASAPKSSDAVSRTPSRPPAQSRTNATASSTSAMMVVSRPSNANVHVDGRLVGTTPLMLPTVAAGDHSIVIEYEGYRRWESLVRLEPGKPSRIAASLER